MEKIRDMLGFGNEASCWMYDMVCNELINNNNVQALKEIVANKDTKYYGNMQKGILQHVRSYYDHKTLVKVTESRKEMVNLKEELEPYI
mmetsp:Transcript_25392/g.24742  ORF Transcript_25392/g.24742 Transcript_25392/m.24742 type:complete len:89 (+) Transcript_25392:712-978(+)